MNDQLKIEQVLTYANLGVSLSEPSSAHLGAIHTYATMAVLLFARHGGRKLNRATNKLQAQVRDLLKSGIKSPVAETNLSLYFSKIFDLDNETATFDAEEVIERRRAAVEWYDGLSEADRVKFHEMTA